MNGLLPLLERPPVAAGEPRLNFRDNAEGYLLGRLAAQIQSLQDGQQSEAATLAKIASRLGVIP